MHEFLTARCPLCGAEIEIPQDTDFGELYECDVCGAEVEVVELDPLELQPVTEIEK
ncbi:MAG: lysine biosynthesis protein LysW [Gemmatimonadetes bacterium]|nr:MAG: lysine biosynthesis protein LysW [Gemmatimonadota bacterium]